MTQPSIKTNSLKQPREEISIKYMHKPPTIPPNYGNQKRTLLPKSKVSRVLLYDNATQDHMLEIKLAHINIEKERICRVLNLHKRSFTTQQKKRQDVRKVTETGRTNTKKLPELFGNEARVNTSGANSIKVSSYSELDTKLRNIYSFTNSEDLKLPNIETKGRHLIFKVKDAAGVTRIYHTEAEKDIFKEILPRYTLYRKLTDDPRFQSLESVLVPSEKEDIFWVSSPSDWKDNL